MQRCACRIDKKSVKKEIDDTVYSQSGLEYEGWTPNPPEPFKGYVTDKKDNLPLIRYVPLIKNVLSDRELMWRDDGKKWSSETTGNYLSEGRNKVIPYPWANRVRSWNVVGEGTGLLYLYSSDSTMMWFKAEDYERPQWIEWKSATACCIMTSKKMIMFKSKDTGIRILLRLIDDRIANAAGENDARVVAYPVRSDVIVGGKSGWWQNWSDISGNLGAQVEKSKAYLMYRHNTVQEESIMPVICTPEPDPYIHSYVPFDWKNFDPLNPNTFV